MDLSEESRKTFLHFRFWMIFLWASLVLGFGVVMMVILGGRRGHKKKGKDLKSRRRSSILGFWDTSEEDNWTLCAPKQCEIFKKVFSIHGKQSI